MIRERTNRFGPSAESDAVLALRALAAVIGDADLGPRFLALTGLEPDELRARAGEPALLDALIGFLGQHEPSLMKIAEELGVTAAALAAARP